MLIKWIPLVFFALRAIEARTARRRVGHAGFAAAAVLVIALASWRYGLDWLRAFRLLARNAESQTSYALPHRLEQLGFPPHASGFGGLPGTGNDALSDALVRHLGAAARGGRE